MDCAASGSAMPSNSMAVWAMAASVAKERTMARRDALIIFIRLLVFIPVRESCGGPADGGGPGIVALQRRGAGVKFMRPITAGASWLFASRAPLGLARTFQHVGQRIVGFVAGALEHRLVRAQQCELHSERACKRAAILNRIA